MYKIDLHTHSIISHDGGISKKQYGNLLAKGLLDFIAITDHNQTSFAKALNAEFGSKIIIGEEISTLDGEIIGLFIKKTIQPGLLVEETVRQIKNDSGLVYIPHPFEKGRSSLQAEALKSIINDVDIIEVFNGRGILRGRPETAEALAINEKISMASSSDAHCRMGIGVTFSVIKKIPTKNSLPGLLKKGNLQKINAPLISILCPSINKVKNNLFLGI